MNKEYLTDLIHSSIDEILENCTEYNESNEDKKRLVALLSEVSVNSTLKVLEELNILKLPKD